MFNTLSEFVDTKDYHVLQKYMENFENRQMAWELARNIARVDLWLEIRQWLTQSTLPAEYEIIDSVEFEWGWRDYDDPSNEEILGIIVNANVDDITRSKIEGGLNNEGRKIILPQETMHFHGITKWTKNLTEFF